MKRLIIIVVLIVVSTSLCLGLKNFNPCGDVDFSKTGEAAANSALGSKTNSAELPQKYAEDSSDTFACFAKNFDLPTK